MKPIAMKIMLATLAAIISVQVSASAGQQPLERVIGESIRISMPVTECVAPSIVVRISRALEIPAGVEFFAERCRTHPPDPLAEEIELNGLTVREAFDKLVSIDPRYRWLESEGVVIFRPLAAWTDPNHFLNRPIPDFRVTDVGIARAFATVQAALGARIVPSRPDLDLPARTPQGNQHVSVNLGTTSAFEALNGIVRAHGSMQWRVAYCQPEPRLEFAEFGYFTFDGTGGGQRSLFPRDEKGKTYDPCARRN
jgi:hypothetical protein